MLQSERTISYVGLKKSAKTKSVAIIGLGYIGLPTAAVLAKRGYSVLGIDVVQEIVDTINHGAIHIEEPGLEYAVHETVLSGHLKAYTKPQKADHFIIAVPTPLKSQHKPDLSYVEAAARAIASELKKGDLVILESTSPVGTTEKLSAWMQEVRPDLTFPHMQSTDPDINVAYCPERVLPGNVLHEVVKNDRVIGGLTSRCAERAAAFYKTFVQGDCQIAPARTAEMCKLTENAFRDVNIAFANELSMICAGLGINAWELIRLANRHPRVNILQPGPGVGGHCIAVDPWFIVDSAPKESLLLQCAREVNDSKPCFVVQQVKDAVGMLHKPRPTIACFGLSFKADIDDLRESPAVEIVSKLHEENIGELIVVEPHIQKLPEQLNGKVEFIKDGCNINVDIIVLLVDHMAFREVSNESLKRAVVIDTRGLWTEDRPERNQAEFPAQIADTYAAC